MPTATKPARAVNFERSGTIRSGFNAHLPGDWRTPLLSFKIKQIDTFFSETSRIQAELNAQLTQVRRLLAVIDRIRAKAAPLGKPTISGPDRVAAGEVATFEVALTGGTPDYQPVGVNGIALPTGALLYWTAPQKVGMATLTARLRDDNGSTVEVQKRIEVVTTETQTINDELRLWAYTVSPSYREDGVTVPSKEVEAHDVHTWDDVHFQANIKNSDYQYRWSVNGKVETSPDVSHYYYLRPEAEGVYRIVLSVTDARGKSIGAAEWTIRVTDFKPDYSGPSIYDGVIPAERAGSVFKVSSEPYGFDQGHVDNAKIDANREFVPIDAGTLTIGADEDTERRKFVTELLNRRLGSAKYVGTAETLIGPSEHTEDPALARAIRGEEGKRTGQKTYYHGLHVLSNAWSGDVATVLHMLREMFARARVSKDTTDRISPKIQHQSIVQVSTALRTRVIGYHPFGDEMAKILGSYGG